MSKALARIKRPKWSHEGSQSAAADSLGVVVVGGGAGTGAETGAGRYPQLGHGHVQVHPSS